MRLWSLHPVYLDSKGLVACWREGLLARRVLKGETRGYQNHPQLERFKAQIEPVTVLDSYLLVICEEAAKRGFTFNRSKIGPYFPKVFLTITEGQLKYELNLLKAKLRKRNVAWYEEIAEVLLPLPHPIFRVVQGVVEPWERVIPEILFLW